MAVQVQEGTMKDSNDEHLEGEAIVDVMDDVIFQFLDRLKHDRAIGSPILEVVFEICGNLSKLALLASTQSRQLPHQEIQVYEISNASQAIVIVALQFVLLSCFNNWNSQYFIKSRGVI